MIKPDNNFRAIRFERPIIVIVGGYGSGKSEVAVNLAYHLAKAHDQQISIADLDIVNPYFRSREAAKRLDQLGVKSIVPPGEQFHADLPIVLPQIKGAIESPDGTVILDVGGDDVGARVLSSLADAFGPGSYELLLVLNKNRPFTSDLNGCMKLIGEIEAASRLKFTGIIANTHLIEYTTPEVIREGLELAETVSRKSNLPVVFLSAMSEIIANLNVDAFDLPILPLDRFLLKPWERQKQS
jgi:hypothetical protein